MRPFEGVGVQEGWGGLHSDLLAWRHVNTLPVASKTSKKPMKDNVVLDS